MPGNERVAVFIDGSNLYLCLRSAFGSSRYDLGLLVNEIVGDRRLLRVYYYNAAYPPDHDQLQVNNQQRFLHALRSLPYWEVRLGRLVPRDGVLVEKGVDVKIAVDMSRLSQIGGFDTAILLSGDVDLSDVVQAVKDQGRHVELAFPITGCSQQLRQACDKFTVIDAEMLQRCGWQP